MLHARLATCVCGMLIWCGVAWGEVRALDASVEAQILQNLSSGTVNSDQSFEALSQTTPNLPLIARAHLDMADPNSLTLSNATATCIFSDPRSSPEDNPREFAFETAMFSFDSETTYGGTSRAAETRTIAFTESEIGVPEGTELLVTSHLYLDGYLALWGDLDLSENPSSSLVYVRIEQIRPADGSSTVVLETTITLTHDSAGNPVLTAEGAVGVDNLLPPDDTLDDVFPLGLTYLVTIPQLSIPYQYSTTVGEEFTLKAEIQCRVANQPFTGAAVSLGKPLQSLVDAIVDTMRNPLSESVMKQLARSAARTPAKPMNEGEGTQIQVVGARSLFPGLGWSACGGLGLETMALFACFPAMLWAIRRRR